MLLESQKTALGDAEEEVMRLTEEHQQALKNEGFEKAAVPEALLTIPDHLEGTQRDAYQAKLEELKAERTRYEQATAAITGNLQAYTKTNAPKEEKKDGGGDKMDEESPNKIETNPPKEIDEAAKLKKEPKPIKRPKQGWKTLLQKPKSSVAESKWPWKKKKRTFKKPSSKNEATLGPANFHKKKRYHIWGQNKYNFNLLIIFSDLGQPLVCCESHE